MGGEFYGDMGCVKVINQIRIGEDIVEIAWDNDLVVTSVDDSGESVGSDGGWFMVELFFAIDWMDGLLILDEIKTKLLWKKILFTVCIKYKKVCYI